MRIFVLLACSCLSACSVRPSGTGGGGGTEEPDLMTAMAACHDGLLNQTETDVDCGGPCGKCAESKKCKSKGDCLSAICLDGTCTSAAICSDKNKDGDETDIHVHVEIPERESHRLETQQHLTEESIKALALLAAE